MIHWLLHRDLRYGRFPATKQVFVSKGMSYAFLSGFFFPWTLEANINKDVPIFRMPAIMAHEQAHVRGFMRENEANFLTYLIARHTRNGDLKYSCLLLSFNYVMNALYKASKEQHREVLEKLSPRVCTICAASRHTGKIPYLFCRCITKDQQCLFESQCTA